MTYTESDTPFPIIEVDPGFAQGMGELRAKRKYWFHRDDGDASWLFKADERLAGAQAGETQGVGGVGEDWSEKIASEICVLLDIPHVRYEMAVEKGTGIPGVICQNIVAGRQILVLGNQLMLERDPAYPSDNELKYGVREHTVDAVLETLASLQRPPDAFCENLPESIQTAEDVFLGYTMLDALIANQDRHHQNWAAIREGGRKFFCSSDGSVRPRFSRHGSRIEGFICGM
ncbi:HipA domain-containing protein [Allorhodopirellula solitaria]|uniref:HipA-like C-terminal domain-containing protein n=1 Tax=Allorhodopirellula solitaria TaxID=2527987 RepID=A0A5C5YEX5_9BACT|nr:hypothetical protein [Allorhodopirellula solitaria]TWT73860.1 hypothetical protein CA85_07410 [Allorhodopirellula solitaria]